MRTTVKSRSHVWLWVSWGLRHNQHHTIQMKMKKPKCYYSFYKAVNSRVCALSRSLREVFQTGARSGKRHLRNECFFCLCSPLCWSTWQVRGSCQTCTTSSPDWHTDTVDELIGWLGAAAAANRGREQRVCQGCVTAALGRETQFRGLFPRVVIRRRGMKKADFQGISMISENTKSILVLSRGLLWLLWTVKKWQNQIESARG